MTKEELELKKLALEVEELQTNWWKKPRYLSIIIPAFLTIFTIFYGITTEYIDFNAKEIGFEKKTQVLDSSYNALKDTLATLQLKIDKDTEFYEKSKQLRYLEQLTSYTYNQIRSQDEIESKLEFLLTKYNEFGVSLFGTYTVVATHQSWLDVKEVINSWTPNESSDSFARKMNAISIIFYDLRKEIIKKEEPE